MKPYYDDGRGIVIYHGDCREILPQLPKVDFGATRFEVTTDILFATAAQEAKAFLCTKGLWKEALWEPKTES